MKRRETGQRRTEPHPLFGELPFVEVSYELPDGRRGTSWVRDLEFRPPTPAGAVPGDIEKQEFCSWCHAPHYYYVDKRDWCVQCRELFVFSAEEQKARFWEGALQEEAGRLDKARQAYELFLGEAQPVGRCRTLREKALGRLESSALVESRSR